MTFELTITKASAKRKSTPGGEYFAYECFVGSCANVFCGIGRECVEGLAKEPVCDCIERCFEPPKPICASDGVTYENECEMHRTACSAGKVLRKIADGSCKKEAELEKKIMEEEKRKSPQPVVCLEKDRDLLREKLLTWMKKVNIAVESEKKEYRQMLKDLFKVLDEDNDTKLDTMEFVKLLEGNESVSEILTKDKHTNPVLRGLCADALIAITDINSDYKLDFAEFMKCLDPNCALGDRKYKDGDEVPQGCNNCVCACGKWVCTAVNCDNSVYSQFEKKDKKASKMP
eukprot:gene16791-8252_t